MITVGLSRHEIDRIIKILEEFQAQYRVDVAGGSADEVKVRGGRGDTSFYQIEIPEEEFKKIPQTSMTKLADLGIFPEMEVPDFESVPDKQKPAVDTVRVRKNMKIFEIVFIVVFVALIVGFIKKVLEN